MRAYHQIRWCGRTLASKVIKEGPTRKCSPKGDHSRRLSLLHSKIDR